MAARFTSNLCVLILGVFVAPARFVFGAEAVRWITFGVGATATVIIAAAFLVRGRGPLQRTLDGFMVLVAGWAAVSALTLSLPVVGWLALSEGGALAVLATIGLIAHEVLMERPFQVVEGQVEADGVAPTPAHRRTRVPIAQWPS